jgi:hypothetical protein
MFRNCNHSRIFKEEKNSTVDRFLLILWDQHCTHMNNIIHMLSVRMYKYRHRSVGLYECLKLKRGCSEKVKSNILQSRAKVGTPVKHFLLIV